MSTAATPPAEQPDSASAAASTPAPPQPAPTAVPANDDPFHDPAVAHLPELKKSDVSSQVKSSETSDAALPQRDLFLPLLLFLATCASTFWVGATHWDPMRVEYWSSWAAMKGVIVAHWQTGALYMGAVLLILLTHEMGHFLTTVRYGISASYPIFIPLPINSIGTMGAVIGMDGMKANRRQIFDIGLAGPLAGLVVALPVLWAGVQRLDLSRATDPGDVELFIPLVGQWMLQLAHSDMPWAHEQWVSLSELNPLFMAGWVGMLITGLNMIPISQLDGGHTIYALFLDRANVIAKRMVVIAILLILAYLDQAVMWTPMLVLVILLGILHPPTADDSVPLGRVRWAIGLASLAIPVLCFPYLGVRS